MTGKQFSHPEPPTQVDYRLGWTIIWSTISVVWLAIVAWLFQIPTDPKNQILFGLSATRLALTGLALIFAVIPIVFLWMRVAKPEYHNRIFDPWITRKNWFLLLCLGLALLLISIWSGIFLFFNYAHPILIYERFLATYERLIPMLIGIFLTAIILLSGILILRYGLDKKVIAEEKQTWLLTSIVLLILFLGWVFITTTKIGITPDVVGWGSPGISLLAYQIIHAWLAGLVILALNLIFRKHFTPRFKILTDILLCLVLWFSAVQIWSGLELSPSYFAPKPRPPNYETYPYSDAGFYDYSAQSILLGYGFLNGQVVPRPLYILLLAGFHAIAGQDYANTIYVQTLFLALLPIALFLLGKTLHSQALGFSLGLLAIWREANSIQATPWVEVSHSKLLMADLPTTLAIITLTWLVARWLKDPFSRWIEAIFIGGMLGVTTLLRTQSILLLPIILAFGLWAYSQNRKLFIKTGLLIIFGFSIVISPWLIRNWKFTGEIIFDDPATQSAMIAQRYSLDVSDLPTRLPGETDAQYNERLSSRIRQFALSNPGYVARFITAHALNNLISTILILPTDFTMDQRCETYNECAALWVNFTENLNFKEGIFLSISILFFAYGIVSSWRRLGPPGIVPLFVFLVYAVSNAIARNSARRYILPVDWISYFYVMVAFFDLTILAIRIFGLPRASFIDIIANRNHNIATSPSPVNWPKFATGSLIFLLIGLSLPIAEISFTPALTNLNRQQLIREFKFQLSSLENQEVSQKLAEFVDQSKAVILKGHLFYPKYYYAGIGEPGSGWMAYKPYPYRSTGKLGAILITPDQQVQVNLALDKAPAYFPNSVEAIVVGCQEDGYLDALMVVFQDGSNKSILRSKIDKITCPMR